MYAWSGYVVGMHASMARVLAYWTSSTNPAAASNLGMSHGFFNAEEAANLRLKCTPCSLRVSNWPNLISRPGGGEPGGDGGMSNRGNCGRVRWRTAARLRVYGEPGRVEWKLVGPGKARCETSESSDGPS